MNLVTIKKTLSPIAVTAALAAALATAGTVAYLTATSSDVNIFALGKLDIELTETSTNSDDPSTVGIVENEYAITKTGDAWDVISKDPTVTVAANSADCWVFVALGESDNFGRYLSYQLADQALVEGWKPLMTDAGAAGASAQVATASGAMVWYREAPSSSTDQVIHVLAGSGAATGGAVTVDAGVTEAQVRALGTAEHPNPTLTVSAYAVQKAGMASALEAWALVGA